MIDPTICVAISMVIEDTHDTGYQGFNKEGGSITFLGSSILITHETPLEEVESRIKETFQDVPIHFVYGKNSISVEDLGILTRKISEHIETYAEFASDLGFALSPTEGVLVVLFMAKPKDRKMVQSLTKVFEPYEGLNQAVIQYPGECIIWERSAGAKSIAQRAKAISESDINQLSSDLDNVHSIDDLLRMMG